MCWVLKSYLDIIRLRIMLFFFRDNFHLLLPGTLGHEKAGFRAWDFLDYVYDSEQDCCHWETWFISSLSLALSGSPLESQSTTKKTPHLSSDFCPLSTNRLSKAQLSLPDTFCWLTNIPGQKQSRNLGWPLWIPMLSRSSSGYSSLSSQRCDALKNLLLYIRLVVLFFVVVLSPHYLVYHYLALFPLLWLYKTF